MFQSDPVSVDINAMGTMALLCFLVILMIWLSMRFRVFVVLVPVYLFTTIIGILSLEVETPLSPWFEFFVIIFNSFLFFYDLILIWKYGEESKW